MGIPAKEYMENDGWMAVFLNTMFASCFDGVSLLVSNPVMFVCCLSIGQMPMLIEYPFGSDSEAQHMFPLCPLKPPFWASFKIQQTEPPGSPYLERRVIEIFRATVHRDPHMVVVGTHFTFCLLWFSGTSPLNS